MPLDLFAMAGRPDPFPAYAEARRTEPVSEIPALGVWSVTRHADCVRVLRTPRLFSADSARYGPGDSTPASAANMLDSDPPEHDRLRGMVAHAFTAPAIACLEKRVERISDQLLDRVEARGGMELIEELACPLPLIVIAELLGVPTEPLGPLRRSSDALVAAQDVGEVTEARRHLTAFFEESIEAARLGGGQGLIKEMVTAVEADPPPTMGEIVQQCLLLTVAGNETTRNLIGNAVLALLRHPESLERLRAEPGLIPSALEEVARFYPPVQCAVRYTTGEVELGGRTIPARRPVFVWLSAANRDETVFVDPDVFDITRRPTRHLAFGYGQHSCLGRFLGRMEATVALRALLSRFGHLRLVDEGEPEMVESFMAFGVRRLRLAFGPGVRTGVSRGREGG